MAKSERITRQIRQEILAGRHGGPGDEFFTVRDLAARFHVSLTTAQKVVKRLKSDGLLAGAATSTSRLTPVAGSQAVAGTRRAAGLRRLALIVNDITNPFFSRLCRYVQRAAIDAGFQVLVASSESDYPREQMSIEGFLRVGVEGLLICPGLDEQCAVLYRRLMEQQIPLGFISRRVPGVEADFVVVHNFVGGAVVAGHLLSIGYDSFGYLGFGPRLKQDERLQGFRTALLAEGIELRPEAITDGDGRDIVHGHLAMEKLAQRGCRPRALFAFNDLVAIGALQYCQERGIAVPGELAIVGFDNLPECRVTSPPLTSVAYPVQSIAGLAVQNLVSRIEGGGNRPPHRILLEPHLVVRGSSDPAARAAPSLSRQDGEYSEAG